MPLKLLRLDWFSVRTRLFAAIFAPSFIILVVASAAALISDVVALRSSLERQAKIDAELLANANRNLLGIGLSDTSIDILSSLRINPDILAAAVYRGESEIFTNYQRYASIQIPARPVSGEFGKTLDVTRPIMKGDAQIGTVWVKISLTRFYNRLRYYAIAVVLALLSLSVIAAVLARFLQKQFSAPIEELAITAKKISGEQDYSVRAPVFKVREFEALTQAFNHMLDRIQRQNRTLTERAVELEKANTELSTANKELEAFTYTVSHDLRTPLRAIASYSELLEEEAGPAASQQARGFMERVQKNALKMAQLIDELLAFSRLDAHPLEKTDVDMSVVSREVWEDIAAHAQREPSFRLSTLPRAHVDPVLIRQVLANLLGNAVKYSRTRPAPEVELGALEQKGECIYFIRDNGVGFNMQNARKLFGIFQRLHSEHEFEGTGVGLAIVHRILSRHGGRIWAESSEGQGATFFFTVSRGSNGPT